MHYRIDDTQRVTVAIPDNGTVEFWVIVHGERVARFVPASSFPDALVGAARAAFRLANTFRSTSTKVLRVEVVDAAP